MKKLIEAMKLVPLLLHDGILFIGILWKEANDVT